MKKINISLFFLCSFVATVTAQFERKKIGFVPYTDPEFAVAEHRELAYKNIYEMAIRIFINTQRFTVLNRTDFDILKLEQEFQKGEDFLNSEIIQRGKFLAAEVLVVAKIATFKVTESDDGEGFSVFLTAEVKQIDVASSKAVRAMQLKSEIIDGKTNLLTGNKKRISTAEEAISRAVEGMEKELSKWIKDQFPMWMRVVDTKDGEMSVIADGGIDTGLDTKNRLRVGTIKLYSQGKFLFEPLAELSLTKESIGQTLTKLKVSKKAEWEKLLTAWQTDAKNMVIMESNR
jgi:Curli production assembly/transport component CsgG